MCDSCVTYPYPVSVSDFTGIFQKPSQINKKKKSKKTPRLNNDERKQAIGMQTQACQQLLYRGALVVLERLSSVYGDDFVSQETLPTVLEVVRHV